MTSVYIIHVLQLNNHDSPAENKSYTGVTKHHHHHHHHFKCMCIYEAGKFGCVAR